MSDDDINVNFEIDDYSNSEFTMDLLKIFSMQQASRGIQQQIAAVSDIKIQEQARLNRLPNCPACRLKIESEAELCANCHQEVVWIKYIDGKLEPLRRSKANEILASKIHNIIINLKCNLSTFKKTNTIYHKNTSTLCSNIISILSKTNTTTSRRHFDEISNVIWRNKCKTYKDSFHELYYALITIITAVLSICIYDSLPYMKYMLHHDITDTAYPLSRFVIVVLSSLSVLILGYIALTNLTRQIRNNIHIHHISKHGLELIHIEFYCGSVVELENIIKVHTPHVDAIRKLYHEYIAIERCASDFNITTPQLKYSENRFASILWFYTYTSKPKLIYHASVDDIRKIQNVLS
jgi:hypothetical protein